MKSSLHFVSLTDIIFIACNNLKQVLERHGRVDRKFLVNKTKTFNIDHHSLIYLNLTCNIKDKNTEFWQKKRKTKANLYLAFVASSIDNISEDIIDSLGTFRFYEIERTAIQLNCSLLASCFDFRYLGVYHSIEQKQKFLVFSFVDEDRKLKEEEIETVFRGFFDKVKKVADFLRNSDLKTLIEYQDYLLNLPNLLK